MIPSPISYWNKTTVTIVLFQGPAQYEVGGGGGGSVEAHKPCPNQFFLQGNKKQQWNGSVIINLFPDNW